MFRAATSTVSGSCRNSWDRRRISSEKVALKRRFWRLAGQEGDDLADVRDEAHVEHPVRLVEDEDLDLGQVHRPLPDVVHEPARGGHEDLDAGPELLDLGVDRDAAVDDGRAERDVPTVGADALRDLHRELAGGRHHERPDRVAGGREARVRVDPQALEDRQGEGGRLAGAGLGGGEEVAALEDERDRPLLDGGGLRVALLRDRAKDVGREAEGVEGQAGLLWPVGPRPRGRVIRRRAGRGPVARALVGGRVVPRSIAEGPENRRPTPVRRGSRSCSASATGRRPSAVAGGQRPARVSLEMFPARGIVARFAVPCDASAVIGSDRPLVRGSSLRPVRPGLLRS